MWILGFKAEGHDSSAALVKDGELVFAIEEERLTREKHTSNFPLRSIKACLEFASLSINDVGALCVGNDFKKLIKKRLSYWHDYYPMAYDRMENEIKVFLSKFHNYEQFVREQLCFDKEIYFCDHHTAHLASSYYLSKFNNSALYSIDGCGDEETYVIGEANENEIKIFQEHSVNYPVSIGLMYTAVTRYLGFKPHCDEGKVMGLAPYGNIETYKKEFERIVSLKEDGKHDFDLSYFDYPFIYHSGVSKKFIDVFGLGRESKTEITQRHMDIAAALQYITERAMVHTANYLYEITKNKNLCLAGGVALNCVANGKILYETPFENIFVQPAANDAGTAIGAALYYYYLNNPKGKRYPINHTYLGNGYSNDHIENILRGRQLKYYESDNVFREIAGHMADGKIIGWFNGRMEFGPRALGNRSILTAPFPAEMKDILNAKVKHREGFRPFAPSVRFEDCSEYFDHSHESPYMLLTYNVKDEYIDKIPAVTHVDKTARVQTVKESENADYYNLIAEFKKITGVGVVLDTSFNVMGQPIVCNPEEAIDCFLSTKIDYLVLNAKYILKKE